MLEPPEENADEGPEDDIDGDADATRPLAEHERDRLAAALAVARHVREVLDLERGEDDAADDDEPGARRTIEHRLGIRVPVPVPERGVVRRDLRRPVVMQSEGQAVEAVAGDEVVAAAADVVVHPGHDQHEQSLGRGAHQETDAESGGDEGQ